MNASDAIGKIKALLNISVKAADVPAAGDTAPANELKDYQTATGTTVKIDKLEMGGKVFDADGTTPLAGDITLADGTMITAGTDGVITAVTVPAADLPADPAALATQIQALAAKFATGTPDERIANVEIMAKAMMQYCFGWKIDEASRKAVEDQAISVYRTLQPAAMAEALKPLEAKCAALEKENGTLKDALGQTLDLVQKFAAAPSDDPATVPAGKGATAAPSKNDRIDRLAANLRELNASKAKPTA